MTEIDEFKAKLRGEVESARERIREMQDQAAEQYREMQSNYAIFLGLSHQIQEATRPWVEAFAESLPGVTPVVTEREFGPAGRVFHGGFVTFSIPRRRALPGEHQAPLRAGGGRRRRQPDPLLRPRDPPGLHRVRAARPDRPAPRPLERREGRRMVQAEGTRLHQDLRQPVLQPRIPEGIGGPGCRPRPDLSPPSRRARPSTAALPTISSPRSPRRRSSRTRPATSGVLKSLEEP